MRVRVHDSRGSGEKSMDRENVDHEVLVVYMWVTSSEGWQSAGKHLDGTCREPRWRRISEGYLSECTERVIRKEGGRPGMMAERRREQAHWGDGVSEIGWLRS